MKALLHKKDLVEFQSWAENQGWTADDLKSPHEVLRMLKKGTAPIILYKREGSALCSYNCAHTGTLVVQFKQAGEQ